MEGLKKEGKLKENFNEKKRKEFFGGSRYEQAISNSFVDYKDAIDLAKRSQPWKEPSEPEKRFADDLHATVAERVAKDDYRQLKFFTAVNSHLDKKGVDCFFEFDYLRKKIIVTIDITSNPQKERSECVDLVFLVPKSGLDPAVNKKEYLEKIQEFADRLVEGINHKINPYHYYDKDYAPTFF